MHSATPTINKITALVKQAPHVDMSAVYYLQPLLVTDCMYQWLSLALENYGKM